MQGSEWHRLVNEYQKAVDRLDSTVKRFKRLTGKEFEDEQHRVEAAKKACEQARKALSDYLGRDGR